MAYTETKRLQLAFMVKASFANTAKMLANEGSYMLPGVGAARYGYDAAKAFGKGQWLKGIGNTLGAGVNLMGGGLIGGAVKSVGMLGKGLMGAGRLGGKALGATGRIAAPTVAKIMPGTTNLAQKAVSATKPMTDWVAPKMTEIGANAGKVMQNFGTNQMAGAKRLDATLGKWTGVNRLAQTGAGKALQANPIKTQIGGSLAAGQANSAQDTLNRVRIGQQQEGTDFGDMLKQLGGYNAVDPAYIRPSGM